MKIETIYDLKGIHAIAKKIANLSNEYALVLFYGEVGAGKTTLIKEICKCMDVEDQSSSPTFSIINEYSGGGEIIYHIDLYRLKNMDEALETGIDEYLYSGRLCLIEWPQIIEEMIFDEKVLTIHLEAAGESRKIRIQPS